MLVALSYIAAICTTCAFVPQAVKVIATKETAGISLGMYSLFTVGVLLWSIYGIWAGEVAVAAANIVTLLFAATILGYIMRNLLHAKSVKGERENNETSF